MADNQIVPKAKLGFFQRIRKSFLLRKINYKKYSKAPNYLKDDEDVLQALLINNPDAISEFSMDKKIEFVDKFPVIFQKLSRREQDGLLEKRPDFITKLDIATAKEKLLFKLGNSFDRNDALKYIKFMPEEFQVKLLTENVEYGDYRKIRGDYKRDSIKPDSFRNNLSSFSIDAIEKAVIILVERAKNIEGNFDWKRRRAKVPLLSDMDIKDLPVELQLKITLLDNEFLDNMSDEALDKYVGDNILLIKKLSTKKQIGFIKRNPEKFSGLTYSEKQDLLKYDYELQNIIPDIDRMKMNYFCYNSRNITDSEKVKEYIIELKWKDYSTLAEVTDTVRDQNTLQEVARFEPLVLNSYGLRDEFVKARKVSHVVRMLKNATQRYINKDIQEAIDGIEDTYKYVRNDHKKKNLLLPNIAKVVLNEKIMSKVDPKLIAHYINNPNMKDLKQILVSTYGKHVSKILDERPNITLEQISVLDIFDEVIYEKFGEATIHNMLSYESNGVLVLGELARKPEKLEKFEMFSRITEGYFENTAVDFDKKLIMYKTFEKVLEGAREEEFTEERKQNLLQVINDRYMTQITNESATIEIESLEDLDRYTEKRNKMYDDFLEKTNSVKEVKDMISKKFFGLEYGDKVDLNYEKNVISLQSMIYYYNLESFVNDERTQESDMFSKEELDMMELATILNKIQDVDTLKEIYKSLSTRDDVLRPIDFKIIKDKIPVQYSKDLVGSLLTVENAKKRAESGEQGISYKETDDGFEIIKLNGADFKILMHTTGINNSGLNISNQEDQVKVWKYLEEGCSTISASLIEPEMLKACTLPENLAVGFSNVPEKQILGMSHRDAHVSHSKRRLYPNFEHGAVRFNYTDEFMRKTAAQISGQEDKDTTHEYNEIAMYRRYIENDNYKENSYGGRVMPDYIVVYGTAGAMHKDAAKRLGKNGKPIPIIEIDTNAIMIEHI